MRLAEEVAGIAVLHARTAGKSAFRARRRRKIGAALPVLAELVVTAAFLRVGEDLVGFVNLLEFFFRGFVSGIDVGMMLPRELAVRVADLVFRGRARDS